MPNILHLPSESISSMLFDASGASWGTDGYRERLCTFEGGDSVQATIIMMAKFDAS